MILTASKLRENIYKVLDKVLITGVPVEIDRRGKVLKIISTSGADKLANLKKHDVLRGDPENIVHLDWSAQWKG